MITGDKVLRVLLDMATQIVSASPRLNERYFHHFFSHKMQEQGVALNLCENAELLQLHPEWPTHKQQTNIQCAKYRNDRPHLEGSQGHIDFAIGDYDKPEIAVEFCAMQRSWSLKDIVFDLVKLLDKKTPFKFSFLFVIILRQNNLAQGADLTALQNRMNDAINDAIKCLNSDLCSESRQTYFIITEIDRYGGRRHWFNTCICPKFVNGLPALDSGVRKEKYPRQE